MKNSKNKILYFLTLVLSLNSFGQTSIIDLSSYNEIVNFSDEFNNSTLDVSRWKILDQSHGIAFYFKKENYFGAN